MALGGEAGFGRPVFVPLQRATSEHLEQICSGKRGFLQPENPALVVAVSQHRGLKIFPGMRVAQRALSLEQHADFFRQQYARKRLAVVALFVALGIGKFGQYHFSGGAIAFRAHFVHRGCKSLFHLTAFTLCVFVGFFRLGAADPVKAPVLAQVVNHARPFLRCEQTVEPIDAQLPRRYGGGALIVKKPRVSNQAFAFEHACDFGLPPGATVEAAAHQACRAARKVERFTFLGGFGFIERPHAKRYDPVGC